MQKFFTKQNKTKQHTNKQTNEQKTQPKQAYETSVDMVCTKGNEVRGDSQTIITCKLK